MLSLNDITEAYLSASKEDKIRFVNAVIPELIESPIFDSNEFKNAVDTAIILSENKILPRLRSVEKTTGNYSFEEWEEHTPTLQEKISEIEDMIEQMLEMDIQGCITSPEAKTPEPPTIETTLDQKACKVVEYLKNELKPNDFGEFVIDRKELTAFMQTGIDMALRVKKVSRQLKADIFKRAVELFPDIVYIKKSLSGNRTKMLALKSSIKRTVTPTCTRYTPIGILA
jgi:hypothetical protein